MISYGVLQHLYLGPPFFPYQFCSSFPKPFQCIKKHNKNNLCFCLDFLVLTPCEIYFRHLITGDLLCRYFSYIDISLKISFIFFFFLIFKVHILFLFPVPRVFQHFYIYYSTCVYAVKFDWFYVLMWNLGTQCNCSCTRKANNCKNCN